MKMHMLLSDDAILRELGTRLAAVRVARNLTQAALAEQAGVAKRTVERLEAGEVATQLSGVVRICRVLGLLDRLDLLVPEPQPSPMAQLALQGKKRVRASKAKAMPQATAKPYAMSATELSGVAEAKGASGWTWGET